MHKMQMKLYYIFIYIYIYILYYIFIYYTIYLYIFILYIYILYYIFIYFYTIYLYIILYYIYIIIILYIYILYQELIREGASNCVERHLNLIDCNTFLIWTYPRVGHKCCYHSQCVKLRVPCIRYDNTYAPLEDRSI